MQPQPVFTFRLHTHAITGCHFLPALLVHSTLRHYFVSSDSSGAVCLWDLVTKRPVLEFKPHTDQVLRVSSVLLPRNWSPPEVNLDPATILDEDSDTTSGSKRGFPTKEETLCLVTHGRDNAIRFWNLNQALIDPVLETGKFVEAKTKRPSDEFSLELLCTVPVNSLNFCPVSVWDDGEVILLAFPNIIESAMLFSEPVMAVSTDFKAENAYVCAAENKFVKIGLKDDVIEEMTLEEKGVACVQVRADDKLFAIGCWDSSLRLYSCKTLKPLATLRVHRETVTTVAFANPKTINIIPNDNYADGPRFQLEIKKDETQKNYLLSGSRDCKLCLWELY
ncbi:ASTRA complex subunit [Nowakowskiella sp. JEL0407]|nr:ASTRA complex subunit [Nowakowskiella sp. JEL0407]